MKRVTKAAEVRYVFMAKSCRIEESATDRHE